VSSTWRQLDVRGDHHLRLEGAQLVGTDQLLATRDNIADVIKARGMMCAHGAAGTGKTFSITASLREVAAEEGMEICWVQFRAVPTPLDIRFALFTELDIAGNMPRSPSQTEALLKKRLAEKPRVLVCDEAQQLSTNCFELWRHLWDDRGTDIAIIFAGGHNCYKVLRAEPMLSSRVMIWQKFTKMDAAQVLEIIPAFHPIWEDADPGLIEYVDKHAAHGNFRDWVTVTFHARLAMARTGASKIDKPLLQWVFSRMGGTES
jgi:hypothetical protein